jgi:uncharacterized protein (DUF433 family)
MGGVPCIRDLRMTVGMVLGQLAAGGDVYVLLADYPYLERADVLAALRYASAVVNEREVPLARRNEEGAPSSSEYSSTPPVRYVPTVLTLALVTALVGFAIAGILGLNTTWGYVIGFLTGFVFFYALLIVNEQRSDTKIANILTIVSHEESITNRCPTCGTRLTHTITPALAHPSVPEKGADGGE